MILARTYKSEKRTRQGKTGRPHSSIRKTTKERLKDASINDIIDEIIEDLPSYKEGRETFKKGWNDD